MCRASAAAARGDFTASARSSRRSRPSPAVPRTGRRSRTRSCDRVSRRSTSAVAVPGPETATYVAQLRKLAETAKPRPKTATPDAAEVRDATLRERLAALQEAPSAAAHLQVALEYRRLGILDAAFSHLSAAIRLEPEGRRVLRHAGETVARLGPAAARSAGCPEGGGVLTPVGQCVEHPRSAARGERQSGPRRPGVSPRRRAR